MSLVLYHFLGRQLFYALWKVFLWFFSGKVRLCVEDEGVKREEKSWALIVFRKEINYAVELLHDLLANAEAQSDAFGVQVTRLMLDGWKELEHFWLVSSFDANSVVGNWDAQLVFGVKVGARKKLNKESNLAVASCEFKGIGIKV